MAARSPSRVSGCRRTACRGWSTPTPRRRPWTHPGESAEVSTGSRRLGAARRWGDGAAHPGGAPGIAPRHEPTRGRGVGRAPMRQAAAGRRPAPRGAPPRPASRFRVRPVLACAPQRTRRRAAPRRTHDLADERAADDEAQVDGVALHEGVVDGHERHGGRRSAALAERGVAVCPRSRAPPRRRGFRLAFRTGRASKAGFEGMFRVGSVWVLSAAASERRAGAAAAASAGDTAGVARARAGEGGEVVGGGEQKRRQARAAARVRACARARVRALGSDDERRWRRAAACWPLGGRRDGDESLGAERGGGRAPRVRVASRARAHDRSRGGHGGAARRC